VQAWLRQTFVTLSVAVLSVEPIEAVACVRIGPAVRAAGAAVAAGKRAALVNVGRTAGAAEANRAEEVAGILRRVTVHASKVGGAVARVLSNAIGADSAILARRISTAVELAFVEVDLALSSSEPDVAPIVDVIGMQGVAVPAGVREVAKALVASDRVGAGAEFSTGGSRAIVNVDLASVASPSGCA
jgi:hypothetical protein